MNRHAISLWTCLLSACTAAAGVAVAEENPQGIIIEAEDYTAKVPDREDFARTAREAAASGRRAIVSFFSGEHVAYDFDVPENGSYTGWLRYASNVDVRLQVAVDPGEQPEFDKAVLTATGGLSGPEVWKWGKMFEVELAAGRHTLALGSAGFRPDCIFITPGTQQPTDAVIRTDPLAKFTPEMRALLTKRLVPIRPDWLDGAADYRLPDWFDGCRVQAHTRLGAGHMKKDIFLKAAAGFKQMGVDTFTRHIQGHTTGAWWPSSVGVIHPMAEDRNLAKEIIDNAHRAGCRVIVYHAHMYERHLENTQPDWICRNPDGTPLMATRQAFMCFNSPFADYYLTRALELADLGADGFYFDYVHMPKTGCWCGNCRRKFTESTGLEHPSGPDPDDPVWRKLVEFNNLTIETTFLEWREALHRRNPELVMLTSSTVWTGMTDHHLNNRLFRIADSVKMEFSIPIRTGTNRVFGYDKSLVPPEPDSRLALGYTLARDAADGRPSHIWTHGLLDEASTLYATSGMVTHGCVANLDVPEDSIPNAMYRRAFELGRRVSPYLASTKPVRWAAVHWAEDARNSLAGDEIRQWKEVLYPIYGAYHTLLRTHLPVGIVTDSQLEEGLTDGYQVLFLPAPSKLTPAMESAVASFEARGGLVVRQQDSWQWHATDGGLKRAAAAFLGELTRRADSVPVRVLGGPEKMHAVSFTHRDKDQLTIALANDFSWVYTGATPEADQTAELTRVPPPCRDVKILVRRTEKPSQVFDAVTGHPLTAKQTPDGLVITVEEFEHMAVVVVEFQHP